MSQYTYRTQGVCSTRIFFDLDGDVISNVSFENGCNGNLKAISILVNGMTVDEIESKLKGQHLRIQKHILRGPAGSRGACRLQRGT